MIPKLITYVLDSRGEEAVNTPLPGEKARDDAFYRYAYPVDAEVPWKQFPPDYWAKKWGVKKPLITTQRNFLFHDVYLLNMHLYDEVQRTYKAAIRLPGFGIVLVPVHTDTLLESARINGVKKGGQLHGPFVWGVFGGALHLVRIGSVLFMHLCRDNQPLKEDSMSLLTYDDAKKKYEILNTFGAQYTHVREVVGGLFAFRPVKDGQVVLDLYTLTLDGKTAIPTVAEMTCRAQDANHVIDAIVAGDMADLEKYGRVAP